MTDSNANTEGRDGCYSCNPNSGPECFSMVGERCDCDCHAAKCATCGGSGTVFDPPVETGSLRAHRDLPCPACTKQEASACPKDPPCEWFDAQGSDVPPCPACTKPEASACARCGGNGYIDMLGKMSCPECALPAPRPEKPADFGRVCEHGSLARSCLVCELTADLARYRVGFHCTQGAFTDTATIIIPDEPEQVADAVRALTAERDALATALKTLANQSAATAERERIARKAADDAHVKRATGSYEAAAALDAFAAKLRAEGTTKPSAFCEALAAWRALPEHERVNAINGLEYAPDGLMPYRVWTVLRRLLRAEGT